MFGPGLEEWLFTAGIVASFIGLIAGVLYGRKQILKAFESVKINRSDMLLAVIIALAFIAIDILLVRPTQLLFFDDAIYQAMAQSLLHSGQAWMCNYGTATACFSGQVYHEPIGLSFNIAMAFLVHGVNRGSAYGAQLALAALSVFMVFPVSVFLLRDKLSAHLSQMVMALSPVVLVWAMPVNSDMAGLAYSLIAILMLLVFAERRNNITLLNLVLSVTLLLYMKVDYVIYIPLFAIVLLLLSAKKGSFSIKRIRKGLGLALDTRFLGVVLLALILVYPLVLYAWSEYNTGDYGYSGTSIQLTCLSGYHYITAAGNINTANLQANICSSVLFWFGLYRSQYIAQPALYTILAMAGAAILFAKRMWREAAVLIVWFGALFLLYAAFYAGSPTYGVDWRFQLSMIAQISILAGAALGAFVAAGKKTAGRAGSAGAGYAALGLVIALLAAQTYLMVPFVSVNPASIQQAGDARFYENFVYANAARIPASCIVYTYDPTLFNINNRGAAQMSDIYNSSFYSAASARFNCSVLDIGYWCNTPNNICTSAESAYNLTPIADATYNRTGFTYGLYLIRNKSA